MESYLILTSKIKYEEMTRGLYNEWPEQYEMIKVMEWAALLNMLIIPKLWNQPTRWGTSCIVKAARTQDEYDKAIKKLSEYVDQLNTDYDVLDIEMNIKPIDIKK